MKTVVMALSGGMDSTCLLMHYLARDYRAICISYHYGQKHSIEIERACATVALCQGKGLDIQHHIVDLSPAMSLFNSALTSEDQDVPLGHYEENQMKQTVVPNRNAIFASILYGFALSEAKRTEENVVLALGVHSGDHAIYPDCRPEFYQALRQSLLRLQRPLLCRATASHQAPQAVEIQLTEPPANAQRNPCIPAGIRLLVRRLCLCLFCDIVLLSSIQWASRGNPSRAHNWHLCPALIATG